MAGTTPDQKNQGLALPSSSQDAARPTKKIRMTNENTEETEDRTSDYMAEFVKTRLKEGTIESVLLEFHVDETWLKESWQKEADTEVSAENLADLLTAWTQHLQEADEAEML